MEWTAEDTSDESDERWERVRAVEGDMGQASCELYVTLWFKSANYD